MSEYRYLQVQDRDGVLVVRLRQVSLDRAAANDFGRELLAVLDECKTTRLVVNLSAVPQMSAPALAKLMVIDKRIGAGGGKMLLCEVPDTVREVISLAWASRAGEEGVTEDAAVAELNAWQPA